MGYEIARVLKKIRGDPLQRSRFLDALAIRDEMGIEIVAVDQAGVVPLAEQIGLTSYDASYLWLALRLDAELVTLDRRLAWAAAALGVRAAPIAIG